MAILASIILLLAAVALLLGNLLAQRRRARQVARRLQGQMSRDNSLETWMRHLGDSRFGQRSVSIDGETQTLLARLGWRSASERSLFAAFQIGTPILMLGLVLFLQEVLFPSVQNRWIAPVLAAGIGYLLPKRWLAYVVSRREKRIALEISTFIPLLRILFESGMAVEQTLRVMSNEAQQLLPVLTSELRLVLARVDSGLELGEELSKTSLMLSVDEFSDTCAILQQLLHQGGGAPRPAAPRAATR